MQEVDPVALAPFLAGQRAMGVVRSYSQTTGFGFIVCKETERVLGRDVFIQRQEADPIGATVGATVSFTVEMQKDAKFPEGKPKARNVKLEFPGCAKTTPEDRSQEQAVEKAIEAMETQALDRDYTGVIKSFNAASGFGFVACDETTLMFGRDVFLHQSNLGGFNIGDTVLFKVSVDVEKASPQARDLKDPLCGGADAGSEKGLTGIGMVGMMGMCSMLGLPLSLLASMMPGLAKALPAPAPIAPAEGEVMNAAGMSNAEWRREVGLDKGHKTEGRGKLQRLQALVDLKHRFVGIIRCFNRARGFGFVGCDEAQAITGSDVFLHNEQREGHDVGDVVSFAIEIRNGQARAKDLRGAKGPDDRGAQSPPRYQDKERQKPPDVSLLERFKGASPKPERRSRSRSRRRR